MAKRAFTLIEVLLVIGIIILLAGAIIVAINPGRQFAKARDTQRMTDITAILNSIVQNMVDNQGRWVCAAGNLPTTTTVMANPGGYNIAPCITPAYVPRMPIDPTYGTSTPNTDNYNSEYTVRYDPASGRIEVCAPRSEVTPNICTFK